MAVNRFGFPAQSTAEVGGFTITANTELSSGGANILLLVNNKTVAGVLTPGSLNVQLPDPAGLGGYVLEIQNKTVINGVLVTVANTLILKQYNATTAYSGDTIATLAIPAASGGALTGIRLYCNGDAAVGSAWEVISQSFNPA